MSPERQVLGRGLDELLGRAEPLDSPPSRLENQILKVDIERVHPNPHQPRRFFDETSLEELALSLKEQGMLQPIVVSENKQGDFLIIAGERRWRAAGKAGWARVPVIVKKDENEQTKRMTMALVENLQREDLNPIESARAFAWLLQTKKWSQQKLAEVIGWDRSSVANTLRLLGLHPEVQKLLGKNRISFSIAKLLLQEKSTEKQRIWARLASQQKLTVRELEQKLKQKENKHSSFAKEPPLWVQLGCNKLAKKWNLDVALKKGFKKTSIVISFTDPEQIKEFIDHV